jgi:hypothetical protein
VDRFELLSLALRELMDAKRFDCLHGAIDNLDFQLAANVLRNMPLGRRRETEKMAS